MAEKKWLLQIVEMLPDGGERVEKTFTYSSERKAERADDGVNINLNHERFFTRIVSPAEQ